MYCFLVLTIRFALYLKMLMKVYRTWMDSKMVTGVLLIVLFEDSYKLLVISDCHLSDYFSTDSASPILITKYDP